MRVSDLTRMWLVFKRDEVGATTFYTYQRLIRDLVIPAVGARAVDSIRPVELQALLMGTLEQRSENEALKLRAVLRGLFGYARALDLIDRDPASGVRLPKGVGTRRPAIRQVPPPSDALELSGALAEPYSAMPLLAAFAGLRWQEIATLQAGDFDVPTRTLSITRALGRVEGVKGPKSVAGRRKTVWAADVHETISALVEKAKDAEWVFTSSEGCLLHYSNWRARHWLPACEQAGLSWTFHEYRHTFAVESLRRGRSVQSVAAMMGHSNPRVTWEFYAGLFDDHLERAREVW